MPAKFISNRALGSQLANQFGRLIEQGGFVAERETKRRTPVDTGNLKNGFHADIERTGTRITVTLGNNVEYAVYVEFGTAEMTGRHMLANGMQAAARWLAARGFKVDYDINR